MEYRLIRTILNRLPIPFAGLRIDEIVRVPTPPTHPVGTQYLGVIWHRARRHFMLHGLVGERYFVLDSTQLQATNSCGVYTLLFAFLICFDIFNAEKLFVGMSRKSATTPELRVINDNLMIEVLQDFLRNELLA